jgi:hypothetical protein
LNLYLILHNMSGFTRTSSAHSSSSPRFWTMSAALPPKHPKTSAEGPLTEAPTPASSPMIGGGASSAPAECASSSSESGTDYSEQVQAAAELPDVDHPLETQESGSPATPVPASWLEKASERVKTLINQDDILGVLCAHYGMCQDHPTREVMRMFLNEACTLLDDDSDIPPYMVFQIGNLTQRRFPMKADAETNLVILFQTLRKKRVELDSLLHKFMSAHHKMRNTSTLKGQFLALTAQVRHSVAPPPTKLEFERVITYHIHSMIVDAVVFTQYMEDFRPFMAKEESA